MSIIAYSILINAEPATGYPSRGNVLLWGSLAIGILGGLVFLCIRKWGVMIIGALAGFVLAIFLLSLKSGGIISAGWGKAVFIIVFVIIGIVTAFFIEKEVVIVGTSLIGAYGVAFGVDCFAHTGFRVAVRTFISERGHFEASDYTLDGKTIGLIVSFFILAVIGIIVQFRMNHGVVLGK